MLGTGDDIFRGADAGGSDGEESLDRHVEDDTITGKGGIAIGGSGCTDCDGGVRAIDFCEDGCSAAERCQGCDVPGDFADAPNPELAERKWGTTQCVGE